MTAGSLNIDGGVHLIKPTKLYLFTAKHHTHKGNVSDIVSYPRIIASLNEHNWNNLVTYVSDVANKMWGVKLIHTLIRASPAGRGRIYKHK